MRSLHHDTAKLVSEMSGENTQYDNVYGGAGDHTRTVGVPLIRPDEVRMLGLGDNIVISDNLPPARVRTRPVDRVPKWKQCLLAPAKLEIHRRAKLKLLDMSQFAEPSTSADVRAFINDIGRTTPETALA